jgi:membrane protein
MKATFKNNRVMKKIKEHFKILVQTVKGFIADGPVNLASTTAYFAIFSIAPILIIIISIFGYFAGDTTIRYKLFEELNNLIGQESTLVLQNAIKNYQITEKSHIGTIIGVAFFLFSATTLFNTMQSSINYIWRVKVKAKNLKMNIFYLIRDRILSFGVILSLGFILLVSLLVDALITYLKDFLTTNFSDNFLVLAQLANLFISLAIISTVFTVIYHFMPDVKVRWNASWFGGIFTAVLFTAGKFIIGFVVGNNELGAVYGAASSFIGILLWVYYASLIFYFGVELTRQFSIFYNHENKPLDYAVSFKITTLDDENGESVK